MGIFKYILWNIYFRYFNYLPFKEKAVKYIKKCSIAAQYLHYLYGGKIIYAVRSERLDRKVSDHFLNIIDGNIVENDGRKICRCPSSINGLVIHLSYGDYKVIEVADEFSQFSFKSVKEMIETTKRLQK
jgi:hypothetical protein